jgi:hypothetical protein
MFLVVRSPFKTALGVPLDHPGGDPHKSALARAIKAAHNGNQCVDPSRCSERQRRCSS